MKTFPPETPVRLWWRSAFGGKLIKTIELILPQYRIFIKLSDRMPQYLTKRPICSTVNMVLYKEVKPMKEKMKKRALEVLAFLLVAIFIPFYVLYIFALPIGAVVGTIYAMYQYGVEKVIVIGTLIIAILFLISLVIRIVTAISSPRNNTAPRCTGNYNCRCGGGGCD
jgi:hypothetical protein